MEPVEQLSAALRRGELVVVAGTGVTANLSGGPTTASWGGLLADGIEHVKNADSDAGALLEMRLDRAESVADLTSIADEIRRRLGDNFGRWLSNAVGTLPAHNPALAHALAKLNVPILTTNYDTLLEQLLGRASATWSRPDGMRAVLRKESSAIGHFHGVWNEPDGVVFSEADYRRIVGDAAAQEVQRGAFAMKTFLFIGSDSGLDDPNFGGMVGAFGAAFPSSSNAHFRLCLTSDVDPASAISPLVDIAYGQSYSDLPAFIATLAENAGCDGAVDVVAASRGQILDRLRDNSMLWREAEVLDEKPIDDLIVQPIFLPEPHDQYATNSTIGPEKDKPNPVDLTAALSGSGIVVIAGEENSGVSTAISWALNEAMRLQPNHHAVLIEQPLAPGPTPVTRAVQRTYTAWRAGEVSSRQDHGILGIDNLRFEESDRFNKAIRDAANIAMPLKVIGARQEDAIEIVNSLREYTDEDIRVVYLGRFSSEEAREIARRVAPGREETVASAVMDVIREKNLQRTPFTIIVLVELVRAGVVLHEEESETAVLNQYLDLLLTADFARLRGNASMTLRNKRLVLEQLARKLVEERDDKVTQSKVLEWLQQQFHELGWDFDALGCLNDLIERRVLARDRGNTVRFQRSAYLELMAGIAAKDDINFRRLVFGSPIQLASIVRTYAAMARNDAEVVRLVETEIDRIYARAPTGAVFGSVRRIAAKAELFADRGETDRDGVPDEQEAAGDDAVERDGLQNSYYDDSDDSDSPAFMAARIEDLSPARLAMHVVDLASRVVRDSDEIRDQALKARVLKKLLIAWVTFTDLHEEELSQAQDLDESIKAFFPKSADSDEDLAKLRDALLKLAPCFLTFSGLRYCLGHATLVTRLTGLDFDHSEEQRYGALIRTLALFGSGTTAWIDSLRSIDDHAVRTFFSAVFLASLARYAYIRDNRLTDANRNDIRDFLRRVITERYSFKDIDHKNKVLNSFENSLRTARLQSGRRRATGLEIAI